MFTWIVKSLYISNNEKLLIQDQPPPLLCGLLKPIIVRMVIIAAAPVIPHVQNMIRLIFLFLCSLNSESIIV